MYVKSLAYAVIFLGVSFIALAAVSIARKYTPEDDSKRDVVSILPSFLSPAEVKDVLKSAENRFAPSGIVDPTTGENLPNPSRTSSSMFFYHNETPTIRNIEERASKLANLPIENIERVQLVRYQFGQFYALHYDYLPDTEDVRVNGQRVVTIFVYLNTLPPEEVGGGTYFPKIGLELRPREGDAAMWRNVNDKGKLQELTLHSGQPINRPDTVKYGMNIWIRDKPQKSRFAQL
jgi:prolyl 4-hydroxylase